MRLEKYYFSNHLVAGRRMTKYWQHYAKLLVLIMMLFLGFDECRVFDLDPNGFESTPRVNYQTNSELGCKMKVIWAKTYIKCNESVESITTYIYSSTTIQGSLCAIIQLPYKQGKLQRERRKRAKEVFTTKYKLSSKQMGWYWPIRYYVKQLLSPIPNFIYLLLKASGNLLFLFVMRN